MKLRFAIIGSGNVAWHLAHALDRSGHSILQIISKTEANAKKLASKFGSYYGTDVSKTDSNADIVLIAVNDDALEQVAQQLPQYNQLIVHTCGSKPMDILAVASKRYGIFYPLQTFSVTDTVDMLATPFFIEANQNTDIKMLESAADSITNFVVFGTYEERLTYHLAAVFANNFSNHMFTLAKNILETSGLEFDVLKPIILSTAKKVQSLDPSSAQTGPARRDDKETMNNHKELLQDQPEWLHLYNLLSESIKKHSS